MMPRAVSTSARCASIERVPRTVVAISEPIADERDRHDGERDQHLDQREAGWLLAAL